MLIVRFADRSPPPVSPNPAVIVRVVITDVPAVSTTLPFGKVTVRLAVRVAGCSVTT